MAKPKKPTKLPIRMVGDKEVLDNLHKAIRKIKGNTREGVQAALGFVKGESQKLTSVDEGVLINSAFFRTGFDGSKDKPAGVVGYTAEYAPHVHDMPDDTNWNKPGAENEFLLKAVVRNVTQILNILKNLAGRKPL